MRAIVYYRDRRGGKSLQFQQDLANSWCQQRDIKIVGQVIESEDGRKRSKRPELERALRLAQLAKAILFIPSFGQMSRNADVIGKMLNHGIEVCTPDVASLREPGGTKSVLKVMASVAEFEVEETKARARKAYKKIQQTIKETGQHVTRKGKVIRSLGNASTTKMASAEAIKTRLAQKLDYTAEILPVMQNLHDRGCRSSGEFAKSLTAKKIVSPRGRTVWTASMARNVMDNCGIKSTARLEFVRKVKPAPQVKAPAAVDQTLSELIEQTPNESTEMLRRKTGASYGDIKRAREALDATTND
jgi:DNA invertase Pin-like site-specific DNA recombinase